MNICVWIIGSNASGKTTQAKLLHSQIGNGEACFFKGNNPMGVEYKFTTFGDNIANLGQVGNNQCTGADTINKKESFISSYNEALKHSKIVVVDAIMATGTWVEFLKKDDVKLFVVLLNYSSLENNLLRLKERRANKKDISPADVTFNAKTLSNVASKIKTFKSLYERVKDKADLALEVPAELEIEEINKKILNSLFLFI